MKLSIPKTLSKQERQFCELYVMGQDPYGGNPRKCYADIFKTSEELALKAAKELLEREDVKEYTDELRRFTSYETVEMKTRLTEKLLRIIDETSTAQYHDRRGVALSPAPLRSVAVQAAKALMEMYPVKVAQENKVELSSGDSGSIVFNVIAPQQPKDTLNQEEE